MQMIASWRLAVVFAGLVGCAQSAHSLCTVACVCTVTTTSVVFGTYNPLSVFDIDSTGTVKVQCTGTSTSSIGYTVAMNAGSGASIADRSMSSGSSKLFYNLYAAVDHVTVVGDGTSSNAVLSGSVMPGSLGTNSQTSTVYGRIRGGQIGVLPGLYTDNLVVTVTY